ncbi:MAG: pentapeptide repeat-containing protein [Bacteroidales bacterium]|nr:pentapeptide repeat-containing protein [Bacteroidales bacterium]
MLLVSKKQFRWILFILNLKSLPSRFNWLIPPFQIPIFSKRIESLKSGIILFNKIVIFGQGEKCILDGYVFINSNFSESEINNCKFINASFYECSFKKCTFKNGHLLNSYAEDCYFKSGTLYQTIVETSIIKLKTTYESNFEISKILKIKNPIYCKFKQCILETPIEEDTNTLIDSVYSFL